MEQNGGTNTTFITELIIKIPNKFFSLKNSLGNNYVHCLCISLYSIGRTIANEAQNDNVGTYLNLLIYFKKYRLSLVKKYIITDF